MLSGKPNHQQLSSQSQFQLPNHRRCDRRNYTVSYSVGLSWSTFASSITMVTQSPSSPSSSQPLLGIRLSHIILPSQTDGMNHEELVDSLDALIRQEVFYRCGDYLSRQQIEASSRGDDWKREGAATDPAPDAVDASCREKMCEWSYRVCDHFKIPRNIVAVAFSFLHRFVNGCSCDRTAFKLASMTALYVATKVFDGRQLSISTLAELSRGEFEVSHISEMEMIMLRTLDWKLNPPTVQDFIQYFLAFLPSQCSQATYIAQRAMFFAELSVYDYDLISHDRGVIALAGIFNAIEAVLGQDPHLSHDIETYLLDAIQCHYPCGCSPSRIGRCAQSSVAVQSIQRRLWYVFSCSAQSVDEKAPSRMDSSDKKTRRPNGVVESKQGEPKSPTSVHQVTSVSPVCVTDGSRL